MNRTAMLLGAGVAVGLLAGVLAGRHWAQLVAQVDVERERDQRAKLQQSLADAGGRFDAVQEQLRAVQRDGEKSQQRVKELEAAVKAAQDEAEALRKARPKAGSDEALPPPPAATLSAPVIRVREVNLPLRMLIADVGSQGGMQAGMGFVVVHEKTPVADVRASDVRETFTGMVIEKVYAGQQPAPGDRLVARRK
jgi:hypothetical protein